MLFNYTVGSIKKFGYTVSQFQINRIYANMQPILRANYTEVLSNLSAKDYSHEFSIGQEETLYIDAF